MLDRNLITIGKLKQAYELSWNDINALMAQLLPNRVYPFALWQSAYNKFWQYAVQEYVLLYQLHEPQFPDSFPLPEEHFPDFVHAHSMQCFFIDISRVIEIAALENGLNYIIEASYEKHTFPFDEQKTSFFRALHQEANRHERGQGKSAPLKVESLEASGGCRILDWFFDTVLVDKPASILFFFNRGYGLKHEVKGLTHALVARVVEDDAPLRENSSILSTTGISAQKSEIPTPLGIPVPLSLWNGKTLKAICADMSEADFDEKVIAHILFYRRGAKKRTVGKLLGDPHQSESAWDKTGSQLFKDSALTTVIDVDDS